MRVPVSEANDLNYLLCANVFLFVKCASKNNALDWNTAHIVIHEVCNSGISKRSGSQLYITPVDNDVGSDTNDNKEIGSRFSIDEWRNLISECHAQMAMINTSAA